jgi:hypothetical protein
LIVGKVASFLSAFWISLKCVSEQLSIALLAMLGSAFGMARVQIGNHALGYTVLAPQLCGLLRETKVCSSDICRSRRSSS